MALRFALAVSLSLAFATSSQARAQQSPGPVSVALGSDFGCGVAADGTVRCWGHNDDGQCGIEGTETVPTPRQVPGLNGVTAVGAGYAFACALRLGDTGGEVWCWGDGGHGQLGVTGVDHRATPARIPGLENIEELGVGAFFGCARRNDGAVLCWGSDDSGNLGSGSRGEDRATPGRVRGIRAERLWVGRDHACVRERRGRVRCWGSSEHSQAGTRRRVREARPTRIRGIGATDELVLADNFSCALSTTGEVRCWGHNLFNVGDGSIERHPRPVQDTRLIGVTDLSAVKSNLCAVVGGQVRCWGPNVRHQLHVPTPEAGQVVLLPTAVPGVDDAVEVVAGYYTQCLRRRSGAWACWGWNRDARHAMVGVGSSESHVAVPTALPW